MNDYFFNQICLKLPILGMYYKAITDQEQTLAEGLLPALSNHTQGIVTSLVSKHWILFEIDLVQSQQY